VTDHCQVCETGDLILHPRYTTLARVTSDCRPWPAGGELFSCSACGTVQKRPSSTWRQDCHAIYDGYAAYALADGVEQKTFQAGDSAGVSRSSAIAGHLNTVARLPAEGRLLDIGCGTGAFLDAFAGLYPDWTLYGTEYNAGTEQRLHRIPGFQALYVGTPPPDAGRFDMISMVHVLEHLEHPAAVLRDHAGSRLTPDGLLIVQVPSWQDNPFDLLIADHLVHYSAHALGQVCRSAGLYPVVLTGDWVRKEISLVAGFRAGAADADHQVIPPGGVGDVSKALEWLETVATRASEIGDRSKGAVGVFGTAIAATWIGGVLNHRVDFFVDEDSTRIGRTFLDRPVLAPADVPPGADVLVPLAPAIATAVAGRLTTPQSRYHALVTGSR
jgi:SAM-dependent methyltransferase